MIEDNELTEFREWKKNKNKTQLEAAFYDLKELLDGMRGYNIAMPARAFKTLANALMLLKEEICK